MRVHPGFLLVSAAASAVAIGICSTSASAGLVVRTAQADAEIREDQPESARGTVAPTELSIRVTSLQNRAVLVRFDLSGLTSADLQDGADLRLFSRNASLGGTNAGGIKIYGVNPSPLAASWDELTVHYRDAGQSEPVVPAGGHPRSQPAVGTPAANPPPQPIFVTTPITWGSDPSAPTRAPGLKHENPAYSAAAETTNQNRYNSNLAVKAAYDADLGDNGQIDNGPYNYQSYINQPAYMEPAVTGNYPDLDQFDRPGTTVGADATGATLLGYLNYDAKNPARPAGTLFSFTTGIENSPINMGSGQQQANMAALVDYLSDLLDGGATTATFLIFQKNTIDADPAPVRSDNLIFASKEFQPTGGNIGDWAPQLLIGPVPEPGAATALIGLAGAALFRRRRQRGS